MIGSLPSIMVQAQTQAIDSPIRIVGEADEEEEDESPLTFTISGEIDASSRNYTGTRFDTPSGAENENSIITKIPSFDMYLEYNFAPRWTAVADVEYVSGSSIQVDEISMSYEFNPSFFLKGGLFVLPVGYCNSGLSYMDYYTNGDPEGEYDLIPCPMSEIGLAAYGEFLYGISYHASITTGFNPLNFSATNWSMCATQGFFKDETYLSSPAFTVAMGYEGIPGLNLKAGVYFTPDASRNTGIYSTYKDFCKLQTGKTYKIPVTIWFANAQYTHKYFTARASYLQGNIGNSQCISDFNDFLINTGLGDDEMEYTGGIIGKQAISYMGEVGLNLKNCLYPGTDGPELTPFVHYECYDPQHQVDPAKQDLREPASKVRLWSFGLHWKTSDNIAIKCNYTTRKIGSGDMNNMNDINLGLAYSFDL